MMEEKEKGQRYKERRLGEVEREREEGGMGIIKNDKRTVEYLRALLDSLLCVHDSLQVSHGTWGRARRTAGTACVCQAQCMSTTAVGPCS